MTTERIDLYAILGLTRDATQAQISAAYRTLLRRYHPDTRTPADTCRDTMSDAALQQVLTAYAVLREPRPPVALRPADHPASRPPAPSTAEPPVTDYVRSTIHPCVPDQSTGRPARPSATSSPFTAAPAASVGLSGKRWNWLV